MKGYISGPITGYELDERKLSFAGAARAVATELECDVVNPMDIGNPDCDYMCDPGQLADQPPYIHTWACWMKHDLKALLDCDTIVMIPGWINSRGAVVEYQLAESLGYKIIYIDSHGVTSVP